MPPTQIGRALGELGITWIAAHSPQAKGRVERSFGTAQERLVKELRVAGAKSLEQANKYLKQHFIPWWNKTLTVAPASADDAHRKLEKQHDLAAILSFVETRSVHNDYTFHFETKTDDPSIFAAGARAIGAQLRHLARTVATGTALGRDQHAGGRQPVPA